MSSDGNKLPQPLDITGGVVSSTVWQKFCGKCGWIVPKDQKSNICPECGSIDTHIERKVIKS